MAKQAIPAATAPVAEKQTSGWVKEMQLHHQRTGEYRARDLERVLGDPRKSVEVKTSADFSFANFKR